MAPINGGDPITTYIQWDDPPSDPWTWAPHTHVVVCSPLSHSIRRTEVLLPGQTLEVVVDFSQQKTTGYWLHWLIHQDLIHLLRMG